MNRCVYAYMCVNVCMRVNMCVYVYMCICVYMCVIRAGDEGGGATRASDWWGGGVTRAQIGGADV